MHSKSQLATDLKSWRGRDFTPEERDNFDLRNILGKPCLLSIAHQESSDGKTTYANISAISNKMKSYTPKQPDNAVFAFDLSDPDWANYYYPERETEGADCQKPGICRSRKRPPTAGAAAETGPSGGRADGTPPRQCRACRRHRGRHPF
ncbi:phage replication initiation protein, NGO0469 family [Neisseria gonorrhoeae]|uniref:phage replication initiation protein, NGO0469 family n=1 Tax=Neisseria gonorrhoeae TaxID=485 RepID=UPI003D6BB173